MVLLAVFVMVLISEWATFDLAWRISKIAGMILGNGVVRVRHVAESGNMVGEDSLQYGTDVDLVGCRYGRRKNNMIASLMYL